MSDRILVTGADGFIGSHLVELLLKMGHEVRALSFYNSFNHWGWLEDIPESKKLEVVSGDIRDPHFCQSLCENVSSIYHLAALIAIPYSYVAPDSYVDTNVKGTLNLCQAAKNHKVKRFIHTSTSEVYGTAQYVPIDENHPMQPQSPYSASKISADAMAMSFYYTFGLPVTIARPFNTYGPRQSARAIIPTIITQINQGVKTIELGDLSPTRDFNFVKDTCRGFVALGDSKEAIGKTINIGSNTEISMQDTLELIKNIMDSDVEFRIDPARLRPKDSEVFRLKCDNSLIKKLCGYEPDYDIKKGLNETIQWFSDPENLKKYKSTIYNV
jgi:NAD dependent epimerase/dehydratase